MVKMVLLVLPDSPVRTGQEAQEGCLGRRVQTVLVAQEVCEDQEGHPDLLDLLAQMDSQGLPVPSGPLVLPDPPAQREQRVNRLQFTSASL
jgi:hypothetical protein